MVPRLTGFQDSEPVVALVDSAQRPGPVLFAAVFPEFIARVNRSQRCLAVKEASAGWVRPAAAGEDSALRALTARHRWLRSRKRRWTGERRPAAYRPSRCAESTPRGERPCMPQACLTGACPIRRSLVGGTSGAPNNVRRGWSVGRSPEASAARRPERPKASGIEAGWPRRATRRGAKPESPPAERRDAQQQEASADYRARCALSAATSDPCHCSADAICDYSAEIQATRG